MIGTHNSFTFLPPRHKIFNLFSRFWKTQRSDIDEQYRSGVRFFDIHVARSRGKWYPARGFIDLGEGYNSLEDICKIVSKFPDAIFRLILERSTFSTQQLFIRETRNFIDRFPGLWRIDIGRGRSGEFGNSDERLEAYGWKWARFGFSKDILKFITHVINYYPRIGFGDEMNRLLIGSPEFVTEKSCLILVNGI